jgi:hypothetical protein
MHFFGAVEFRAKAKVYHLDFAALKRRSVQVLRARLKKYKIKNEVHHFDIAASNGDPSAPARAPTYM